jgi:hypothetical protein
MIQPVTAKDQSIPPAWKLGFALGTAVDGESVAVNTFPKFNNLPLF